MKAKGVAKAAADGKAMKAKGKVAKEKAKAMKAKGKAMKAKGKALAKEKAAAKKGAADPVEPKVGKYSSHQQLDETIRGMVKARHFHNIFDTIEEHVQKA